MRLLLTGCALGVLAAGCDPANAQSTDDTGECVQCECDCAEPLTIEQYVYLCADGEPYEWTAPAGAVVLDLEECFTAIEGQNVCAVRDRSTVDGTMQFYFCSAIEAVPDARAVITYLMPPAEL